MPWPWPGAVLWGPEASPAPGCAAMLGCFFHVFLRDQWWSWISLLQIFRLKFRVTLNNHSNSTELISSKKQKQRILALAQVHESHRCPGRNLAMRWRIRRISYDVSFIPTEKCHTSNPTEDKSVIVIIGMGIKKKILLGSKKIIIRIKRKLLLGSKKNITVCK